MAISILRVGAAGLSLSEVRTRTIASDQDTIVRPGIVIYFADGGSNLRINNGKLQIRNDSTNNWHSLNIDDVDGIATIYLGDPE